MKQNQIKLRHYFINNIGDWREGNRGIFLFILQKHTEGNIDFELTKDKFKLINYEKVDQIHFNLKTEKWEKTE